MLRGVFSLSHIVKKEILPKETKSDSKNIRVTADEYNLQSLTAEESKELYQIFTEKEEFKNSTLLIALYSPSKFIGLITITLQANGKNTSTNNMRFGY